MKRAVVIALLLAIGLAFGTWWALRPGPRTPSGPIAWLAALSESSIDEMGVSWGVAGERVRLVRAETGDLWLMEASAGSGGAAVRWPVNAAQVRGAVRLLADLATAPAADSTPTLRSDAATITLVARGQPIGSLRLATRGLGGQSPAIIDGAPPRAILVDEGVGRAFERAGVLAWRAGAPFPREGFDPARVTITNPSGEIALARAQGRWALNKPWVAPANEAAVKPLLGALGGMVFARFVDELPASDPTLGFDAPVGVVRVESTLRVASAGDVDRRTLEEELVVGAPADVARSTHFVRVTARVLDGRGKGEVAWGPIVAVVERSRLDAIPGSAGVLASRAAARASAADVDAVTIRVKDEAKTTYGFRRTIDGWVREPVPTSGRTTLDDIQARRLARLIELLCGERAERVSGETPAGARVVGTIELSVPGGPLAPIEQLIDEGAESRPYLLRTGTVVRAYGESDRGVLVESMLLGER